MAEEQIRAGESNIFFPEKLSPQGFLTDMITAQIRSPVAPFPDLKKIIYQKDFTEKLNGKLFMLHPGDHKKLLIEDIPKTLKSADEEGSWWNERKRRQYINFLNNMTPVQQGSLVPYIRLFVKQFVRNGKTKKFIRTKEIVFNQEYRMPGSKDALVSGKGRGNAGIQSLTVDRSFQYYGVDNRMIVNIQFLFDSFDTFANGMQYDNFISTGFSSIQEGKFDVSGKDQGSGYISLIKKGPQNIEGGYLEEYLYLQYGYKFPDTISEEIVRAEDRYLFEQQERKELVITCFKHDFKFSETGEVSLTVTYNARPDFALSSKSEEKTNDVFLITNKEVLDEILDEPTEDKIRPILSTKMKELMQKLKENNDRKKELLKNYCRNEEEEKELKSINELIQEASKETTTLKKSLLNYMYFFFLRYFMANDSLFNLSFKPPHFEAELGVLNPCSAVNRDADSAAVCYINKVSKKESNPDEGFTQSGPQRFDVNYDYPTNIEKIANATKRSIDPSTDVTLDSTNIELRFQPVAQPKATKRGAGDARPLILSKHGARGAPEEDLERYFAYEAVQTFTLSRLAAQASLIRQGLKAQPCNKDTSAIKAETSQYNELYGNITFFPLSALIAAAIDFTIDENEDKDNFPIICLGSVLTDSMGKEYFANMGDLLVDIDFFKDWLYSTFISTEKLSPSLGDFLHQVFKVLVPNILETGVGHYSKGNHGYINKQTFEISNETFNDKELFKNLISESQIIRDEASRKLAQSIKNKAEKEEIKKPLIIYYQESLATKDDVLQAKGKFLKNFGLRNFDKKQDYNDGIYHVLVGQNSGIVKQINFSYVSDQALNTLFSMKNPNHLAPYLRYAYEANVELVGNDLFFNKVSYFAIPRNQFSTEKTGITGLEAEKDVFGLSGYYQISQTSDRISMGEYTTTIRAKNMFSPPLEEANAKKCKKKEDIKKPDSDTKQDKERDIGVFVNHNLAEYIIDAIKNSPVTATTFRLQWSDAKNSKSKQVNDSMTMMA